MSPSHEPPREPDEALQRSWRSNAGAWTDAVRTGRIPSRRAGTDDAIIRAVMASFAGRTGAGARVLDVGCGEGWLARALSARGCEVIGIDGSAELIEAARALGGARFERVRYEELAGRAAELGAPFDAAVCNFALLGEDVAPLLRALHGCLRPRGSLIVQTVHPWMACGDAPYVDGWRLETFAAFGGDFVEPMPWFFRTLTSWSQAIAAGGFRIETWEEPMDEATGRPLSLVVRCSV
jgi:2-polyprenyl-3-methyl-5-hydroxy-6-metoxy-1,4-benzoquinol methylase